ncbi:MAG: hypothetical protein KJ676_11035 [Alphaproteobacteria bacterium]|nr:hypothetical protein [Alphaproteobacteria bacterium]MBU1527519.1 hypothetical protein [Alphaproteobacteria bacterium]MBU2117137.1 hypothetical protein [Alphaproteobacteria bacterium]MBU2350979.1 hypothetical protein [Alphaproteobacteria bacterium]MBU2381882.1 hypothetical protein [Alphaproteobacteria bacterium]
MMKTAMTVAGAAAAALALAACSPAEDDTANTQAGMATNADTMPPATDGTMNGTTSTPAGEPGAMTSTTDGTMGTAPDGTMGTGTPPTLPPETTPPAQ